MTAIVQREVGPELYLFTEDEAEGGSPAPNLLISSHGAYWPRPRFGAQTGRARHIPGLGGWIKVPGWTTLHFYGPHGKALADRGIAYMLQGPMQIDETIGPGGAVRNYWLSKYQTAQGKESYETVKAAIGSNRDIIERAREAMESGDPEAITIAGRITPPDRFDVLTIRRRWWRKPEAASVDITLSKVLTTLQQNGHEYAHIYCSFCRSPMIGRSETHTPGR